MPIDKSHRKQVIEEATELIARGLIAGGSSLPIADAMEDDEAFGKVEKALSSYHQGGEEARKLTGKAGIIQTTQPLFRHRNGELFPDSKLLGRARSMPLNSIKGMEDFDKRILEGILVEIPSAGGIASPAENLLRKARAILAERLIGRLMSGRQDSVGKYEMMPPPLSPEFSRAVKRRFKISTEQYEEWVKMPVWVLVLKEVFHRMMADGVIGDDGIPLLERRRREFEMKRAWFDELTKMGITEKELRTFFAKKILPAGSDAAFRAGGWLRRFMPGIDLNPATAGARASVIVREIEEAHRIGPLLGEKQFLHLLPSLTESFTIRGLRAALDETRDAPIDGLALFRADTLLLWHTKPSQDLINRLFYIIGRNKKYSSLQEFTKNMLLSSPAALKEKIDEMTEAGLDTTPLAGLIRDMFKNSETGAIKKIKSGANIAATKKKEGASMEAISKTNHAKPDTYTTKAGDTFSKVAKETGSDPVALFLQNASVDLVKGSEDIYAEKNPEQDVIISFNAKKGEKVDDLARRLRIYPPFFQYILHTNDVKIDWRQSESWFWFEFTSDVSVRLSVSISVPSDAIVEGALLYMPWAMRPEREEMGKDSRLPESKLGVGEVVEEADPVKDAKATQDDEAGAEIGRGRKKNLNHKKPATLSITTGAGVPNIK